MKLAGVVLGGGKGSRLWPISSSAHYKQHVSFQGRSLLSLALGRLSQIPFLDNIFFVGSRDDTQRVAVDFPHTPLIEPCGRNTAAALLYAASSIYAIDPSAIALIVPCDHDISSQDEFIADIEKALRYVEANKKIVLFGVTPSYPATGYGYIQSGDVSKNGVNPVQRFCEKPELSKAQEFIARGDFLWNTGMICARVSVLIDFGWKVVPLIMHAVEALIQGSFSLYEALESISFDKAVLEKISGDCSVLRASFSWRDVGSLSEFIAAEKSAARIVQVESQGTVVLGTTKPVVVYGVNDLCMVETEELFFVTTKSKMDNTRVVVDSLKNSGYKELL